MFKKIQTIANKFLFSAMTTVAMFSLVGGLMNSVPVSAATLPDATKLCGTDGKCAGVGDATKIKTDRAGVVGYIVSAAQWLTYIIVGIAVIFLVYGGFRYMTSSDGGTDAKKIITSSLIGLVVAIVAATIVTVISQIVNGDFFGTVLGNTTP